MEQKKNKNSKSRTDLNMFRKKGSINLDTLLDNSSDIEGDIDHDKATVLKFAVPPHTVFGEKKNQNTIKNIFVTKNSLTFVVALFDDSSRCCK